MDLGAVERCRGSHDHRSGYDPSEPDSQHEVEACGGMSTRTTSWLRASLRASSTARMPLALRKVMPVSSLDVTPHPKQYFFGGAVIAATVVLYIVFW